MTFVRFFILGTAFLAASAGSAPAVEYMALRDGVPLREAPDASAKVLGKAGKGWLLDTGVDDKAPSGWHEIYQMDPGDGYFYAYLAYGLPGTNVFVRDSDVRAKGASVPEGAPAAPASAGPDSPDAYLATLAAVTVKASDVRLREGAGLHGNIVGKAGKGDRFIALRDTVPVPDGRVWYKLVYAVETQEKTYLEELPERYICADYVSASPLSEKEETLVESRRFHILRIVPSMTAGFTARGGLALYPPEEVAGRGGRTVRVPAGTPLEVFSIPSVDTDGVRYVSLWKRVDGRRIRNIGGIPLDELRSLPMESGRMEIDAWLGKNLR